MIRKRSIFWRVFLTFIAIVLVAHLVLNISYDLLFQHSLETMHRNSVHFQSHAYLVGLASIISIAVSAIFAYYLSKRITAPLRELNRVALQIAKGQFDQKVKINTHDELEELGHTFNDMAQALASLDQMRKDFVANVSHDLRSPLTSIHGFAIAFLDGTVPDERKRHYFTLMKEQTERMMKLVNDLLDMARIEAGQFEIRPVAFNLSELVRQVVARLEPGFTNKGINVELISDEGQDTYAFGDPDRIDQVMVNLVQNALQFSSLNSSIEVILKEEEQAVVSVRDYGPGIRQEDMEVIWQRFYKTDKARTRESGTGIGLSIVKHILDLHGSPIHVISEVGKGSTFSFTLPLAAQMKNRK